MIKNIIFDMGGVLIDFNPEKALIKTFQNKEDVQIIKDILFESDLWPRLDSGELSFTDLADEACQMLPVHLQEKLRDLLLSWWDKMPPFPEMYDFIVELKQKGFKTFLCSNTPKEIYSHIDSIPALQLMDGIIASCDYGVIKPDKRIFEILLEKFSLKPEECFFIDDIEKNIKGAESVGIKGHCYSHGNIEILKNTMSEFL